MAFRVGQKVVCVDFSMPANAFFNKGAVYTVAAIRNEFLDVAELFGDSRGGWLQTRFRPAVETKTDISIFTSMLTGSPVRERV